MCIKYWIRIQVLITDWNCWPMLRIFTIIYFKRSHMTMWTWEYRQVRTVIYIVVNVCLCVISDINSWVFRCSLQNKCLSCFWVWRSSLSFFNRTIDTFINKQLLKYKIDKVVGNGKLSVRTTHTLVLQQILSTAYWEIYLLS